MTERQMAILASIIEQYAEVAAPVGSVTLAKLFGVSSATIRSEMARLEEMGLIMQPHTSAGRIPTKQDKDKRTIRSPRRGQPDTQATGDSSPFSRRQGRHTADNNHIHPRRTQAPDSSHIGPDLRAVYPRSH